MAKLVRRYAGRRLGGTVPSVIAVCERLPMPTVATVNRRGFANVRPRHATAFDCPLSYQLGGYSGRRHRQDRVSPAAPRSGPMVPPLVPATARRLPTV